MAVDAGGIRPGTRPYELMRGIGDLCVGRDGEPRYGPRRPRYGPRRLIEPLLEGLRQPRLT